MMLFYSKNNIKYFYMLCFRSALVFNCAVIILWLIFGVSIASANSGQLGLTLQFHCDGKDYYSFKTGTLVEKSANYYISDLIECALSDDDAVSALMQRDLQKKFYGKSVWKVKDYIFSGKILTARTNKISDNDSCILENGTYSCLFVLSYTNCPRFHRLDSPSCRVFNKLFSILIQGVEEVEKISVSYPGWRR